MKPRLNAEPALQGGTLWRTDKDGVGRSKTSKKEKGKSFLRTAYSYVPPYRPTALPPVTILVSGLNTTQANQK